MNYKVIKDFACVKKGDVFVPDTEDEDMYTMEVDANGSYRYASIDEASAKQYCERGLLIEVSNVEDTLELIDALLEQYDEDYQNTMSKAENGDIQPCVKVEAETVYYNLTKVLNKIKESLINE